jgi:hypothetical protein
VGKSERAHLSEKSRTEVKNLFREFLMPRNRKSPITISVLMEIRKGGIPKGFQAAWEFT